ncbi:hypothetical protein [Acanthopleuribacter pedis]|uniref:Uncharacterized protein n=1 Tax=Acanthopleuribacter pedis TaxID=442870 RepID=A0A8J7QPT6_9BACT|nr:hypothetical protein [Acanthopleuribacter pedis]MBO1322448.1 hypothetical protein [Acanthopleuribacter pedis]
MITGRKQSATAWLTIALLFGVQAWLVHHKAADHHHLAHGGHHHETRLLTPQDLLQWALAQTTGTSHSHDDHPVHPDEDHEITSAPLRKTEPVSLGLPVLCLEQPLLLVAPEPLPWETLVSDQDVPRHGVSPTRQPRAPPLFFVV